MNTLKNIKYIKRASWRITSTYWQAAKVILIRLFYVYSFCNLSNTLKMYFPPDSYENLTKIPKKKPGSALNLGSIYNFS